VQDQDGSPARAETVQDTIALGDAYAEYDVLRALGIEVEVVMGLRKNKALFVDGVLVVDWTLSPIERDRATRLALARLTR
jgi:hypothetical protein